MQHIYTKYTASFLLQAIPRNLTRVKLDEILHLPCGNVKVDRVIDSDKGIRVADRAAIMSHKEGHAFGAHLDARHTAQLVLKQCNAKVTPPCSAPYACQVQVTNS